LLLPSIAQAVSITVGGDVAKNCYIQNTDDGLSDSSAFIGDLTDTGGSATNMRSGLAGSVATLTRTIYVSSTTDFTLGVGQGEGSFDTTGTAPVWINTASTIDNSTSPLTSTGRQTGKPYSLKFYAKALTNIPAGNYTVTNSVTCTVPQ